MIKLYKRDADGRLRYHEAWVSSPNLAVVHWGLVGRRGKSEEREFDGAEAEFLEAFESEGRALGFSPTDDNDHFWLVVQFPMKSDFGNKRDRWLREKVHEHLNEELGWRGLGHVDGFDVGQGKSNVFALVVDADLGVTAAKSCLRTSRLDLSRARIATRGPSDDDYVLQYSKKPVADFSL